MKSFKILTLSVLGGLAFQAAFAADLGQIEPLNSIAAEVNSTIITYGDIERMMRELKTLPETKGISDTQLRQAAQQRVLERTLLADAARQQGLRVTATGIDQELQRRAAAEHTTVDALYARARSLGYTRETYRMDIAKDILITNMLADANAAVKISDAQIDEAMKQGNLPTPEPYTVYTIRRIVLNSDSEENMPAVEKRAQQIAQALSQGSDFAAIAKRYSQEIAAMNGGLHNDITDFMLPENVEIVLHRLQNGQSTVPMRVGRSWQIMKLESSRTENDPTKMQREAVRRQLYRQAQQKNQEQFVGQLQQSAIVRVNN